MCNFVHKIGSKAVLDRLGQKSRGSWHESLINHDKESGLYCLEGNKRSVGRKIKWLDLHFREIAVASAWRLGETEEDRDPSGDMQVHIFFNLLNNT